MRRVLLLAIAASIAACSSQPTTPESTPVAPPVAAAPAADTAPAAATEAPGAAPVAKDVATASTGGKIPSGYRLEKRNGKELYCRNITTLGSRFPQKTCFTREQLEEITRRTDSAMGDLEKGMKVCTGIEGCGQN